MSKIDLEKLKFAVSLWDNAGVDCDDLRTGYETVRHIYRKMVSVSPNYFE